MRNYFTEFVGTFFLVLVVVMTGNGGQMQWMPLAVGSAYAVLMYAGFAQSGAHYNPAVTLAHFLLGKFELSEVLPYIAAQIVGAFLATLLATPLLSELNVEQVAIRSIPAIPSLIAEFLGTFLLLWVLFQVTIYQQERIQSFFGFAVGFAYLAGIFAFQRISGAAFNPAIAIGMMTAGMLSWTDLWIFLVANLVAAGVIGYGWKWLHG